MTVFNNSETTGVIAIGTLNELCASSSNIVFLTNSTSECLKITKGNGEHVESFCDPTIQGANAIYCLSSICFITRPSPVGVIAMDITGI